MLCTSAIISGIYCLIHLVECVLNNAHNNIFIFIHGNLSDEM